MADSKTENVSTRIDKNPGNMISYTTDNWSPRISHDSNERLDKTSSGSDKTSTSSDKTSTGSDKTSSGSDKTSTGTDKTSSGFDKTSSCSDKTCSGSDKTSSGSDKTYSGSDKTSSGSEKTSSGKAGDSKKSVDQVVETISSEASPTKSKSSDIKDSQNADPQNTETKDEQNTNTKDKQIADTKDEQKTNTKAKQNADTKDKQIADTKDKQKTNTMTQNTENTSLPNPNTQQFTSTFSWTSKRKCTETVYNFDGTGFEAKSTGIAYDGNLLRHNGKLYPNPLGVPVLTIDYENVFAAPYAVLDTDYTNFACIYSCIEHNFNYYSDFAFIFSRTPSISDGDLLKCQTAFKRIDVDTTRFVKVEQGGSCPYSTNVPSELYQGLNPFFIATFF